MPKNQITMMLRPTKQQPGKKLLVLRIHFLSLKIMYYRKQPLPNKPLEFLRLMITRVKTPRRLLTG